MSGIVISFEGIDASGKTTQIARLEDWLRKHGCDVLVRREPGGTELGESIRDVLLDPRWRAMHPRTEFLLYSASRAQLVEEDLLPFLQKERGVVLLDRFYDSSTAYQGAGRGLSLDEVEHVNRFATAHLQPHRAFFFDLPLEEARKRKRAEVRPTDTSQSLETFTTASTLITYVYNADRVEYEKISDEQFYERVRQGYLALCQREPQRMVRLDASGTPDEIATTILDTVTPLLQKHWPNWRP